MVYDPESGLDDVILAGESPYAGPSIPLAVGAIVAGMFALVPAMLRRVNRRALRRMRPDGPLEFR